MLIVSASARAIAQSALKGGYSVDVVDRFGDWDLEKSITSRQADSGRLFRFQDHKDPFAQLDLQRYCGLIVAGGFETKIHWLRRLNEAIPLLGCQLEALQRLQSRESLRELPALIGGCGARWPTTRLEPPPVIEAGQWLVKSLAGSGGHHVQVLDADGLKSWHPHAPQIFQARIGGASISALFVARPLGKKGSSAAGLEPLACQWIGCCQQLVGEPVLGAHRFSYCGSIGPIELSESERSVVQRVGAEIANAFQIVGVFGLDLICNEEGIWLVDINPRITASAEIYERASAQASDPFLCFPIHVEACLDPLHVAANRDRLAIQHLRGAANGCFAKGVLFCKRTQGLLIDAVRFHRLKEIYEAEPDPLASSIADLPQRGTQIPHGAPILTLFANGATATDARNALIDRARELDTLLGNDSGP